MPILDVTLVLSPGEVVPADLAKHLADAAGIVLQTAPGTLWLTLYPLPAAQYAENQVPSANCPHPASVRLWLAQWPDLPARAALAADLAQALAPLLQRPSSQVHLFFEPPAAGRIAFGGQLR